jgi:hypothetical protein
MDLQLESKGSDRHSSINSSSSPSTRRSTPRSSSGKAVAPRPSGLSRDSCAVLSSESKHGDNDGREGNRSPDEMMWIGRGGKFVTVRDWFMK